MPVGYHISADEGLITIHGSGDVSVVEIARLGQTLLRDSAYDPRLPQLLDFRGLRPLAEGDTDALRAFVYGPYRNAVAANVAVVIDEHLESRHCADIFLLTCAIHEAELFADYDLALKWLMRRAFASRPVLLSEQEDPRGEHAYRAPE
jgi:hypothetical protein